MNELYKIFERTLDNCLYYEKEEMIEHLLNEIGCLRGIAYALETVGIYPYRSNFTYADEFLRLIAIQSDNLQEEEHQWLWEK